MLLVPKGRPGAEVALRASAPEEGAEGDLARLPSHGKTEGPTFVTGTLQDLFGKPEWPPTYPHVPGVPCKDCGWDGKHAD